MHLIEETTNLTARFLDEKYCRVELNVTSTLAIFERSFR